VQVVESAAATGGRGSSPFWRYWAASAVSSVGDAVTAVALPLTAVTVLHASSFEVSFLTAATYAAWAFVGLPAGVVVQRLPLRGTQVAMDVVRGAALLSVPIAAWTHVLSIAQLAGVAVVVGLASVVFDVGNATFLVSVVDRSELERRNSFMSASHAATLTAGPSLGGLLVQVAAAPGAVLCDVASYLLSATVLSTLPRPVAAREERRLSVWRSVRDGLRYVVRHPVVRPCASMAVVTNTVCGGLMALTPVYLVRTLHAPVGLVGVVMASEGVGTLLGAALTPRLARRIGSARAILLAGVIGSAFALMMPLASPGRGLLVFAIGNAGFAAGVVILSILARTHRQQTTPPELLARVVATVRFVSWGVVPLGALAAGATATAFGLRTAFWALAVLAFLVPAIGRASALGSMRGLADEARGPTRPAAEHRG
jgi:MFS family permease